MLKLVGGVRWGARSVRCEVRGNLNGKWLGSGLHIPQKVEGVPGPCDAKILEPKSVGSQGFARSYWTGQG